MINLFTVNLDKVTFKKDHPYTLYFEATTPGYGQGKIHLTYTGTELTSEEGWFDEQLSKLYKDVHQVFGDGPFDRDKAEKLRTENYKFQISEGK